MKLEFEHHTTTGGYLNEVTVRTTLTVESLFDCTLSQNGNIDLEAYARDSNERRIRGMLYRDLELEWTNMSKVIDEVLFNSAQAITPGNQAAFEQVERFGALLRSKLEPGA